MLVFLTSVESSNFTLFLYMFHNVHELFVRHKSFATPDATFTSVLRAIKTDTFDEFTYTITTITIYQRASVNHDVESGIGRGGILQGTEKSCQHR